MRNISGSTLKIIAVITMFIDHIGAIVLNNMLIDNGLTEVMLSNNSVLIDNWIDNNPLYSIMIIMRFIGRVSFPIFCFLLVEGFYKTRNVIKYLLRLSIFAILSEIPFDLAIYGKIVSIESQNIFFTLAIGLLFITILQYIYNKNYKYSFMLDIVVITIGFIVSELLRVDYGGIGFLVIVGIYLVKRHYENNANTNLYSIMTACIVLFIYNPIELGAFISIPLILCYNGKRGLNLKYIFYAFYPIHLLILWLLII